MRPLDVAVVGLGTAGAAAAVFLARAGHAVTVYERVRSPGPVGAGITLQPTGLFVLRRLGLEQDVVERGARIERLLCETAGGKPIVDLAYRTGACIDSRFFGLGLHRGVLFEALVAAAADASVTIEAAADVVQLQRARGARRWVALRDGRRFGPYDLVVIADGARSLLRDSTGLAIRAAPYPWGALWFVGPDVRRNGDRRDGVLYQVASGNQRFLGLLPTGQGPRSPDASRASGGAPFVSLFWSLRCDALDEWRSRGLEAWKKEVVALCPAAEPVLDRIVDPSEVLFASYTDVVMSRWSARDVVVLGDAAHATSPQLGQGANLALWDAMVLADALASEDTDLARALDRYCRARRGHLAYYQLATRWLTPFFQGDDPALGALRDLAMPWMGKVRTFERIMTLTMLGVVDGFGGDTLAV